jgi:pentatricopeptide repeat protein
MSFVVVALLSGARNEKNTDLAEEVFEQMKRLFPGLTDPLIAASVLLSNTLASSGKFERATEMRMKLNPASAKKKEGLSRTVVNGQFYVSDQ